MTANRPSPRIVVGYDGSPCSRAALRLAVDRVGNGKLFLVHAYAAPTDMWGPAYRDELLDAELTRGEELLNRAAADVDPRLAEIDHELELIPGRPAEVVATVAETRDADEIIVGTRGFGPLRGALGSVAHALLHAAKCPVTVIPDAALERLEETPAADRAGSGA